jgi:archaellum component FlaC
MNENIHNLQLWFVNELNEMISNLLVEFDDQIEKVSHSIKATTNSLQALQSIKTKQEISVYEAEALESIVNNLIKSVQDIEASINQKSGGK